MLTIVAYSKVWNSDGISPTMCLCPLLGVLFFTLLAEFF